MDGLFVGQKLPDGEILQDAVQDGVDIAADAASQEAAVAATDIVPPLPEEANKALDAAANVAETIPISEEVKDRNPVLKALKKRKKGGRKISAERPKEPQGARSTHGRRSASTSGATARGASSAA